jgi:hypothetical protein
LGYNDGASGVERWIVRGMTIQGVGSLGASIGV